MLRKFFHHPPPWNKTKITIVLTKQDVFILLEAGRL